MTLKQESTGSPYINNHNTTTNQWKYGRANLKQYGLRELPDKCH